MNERQLEQGYLYTAPIDQGYGPVMQLFWSVNQDWSTIIELLHQLASQALSTQSMATKATEPVSCQYAELSRH